MMSKKLILLASLLVLVFFLNGVEANSCNVVEAGSCNVDNVVMELSSTTNAHGSVYGSDYPYVLCCDFSTINPHTCSGTNDVLKLSSPTNAHAEITEITENTTYETDICYGDLVCESAIGSCQENQEILIRLSADTNAHLESSLETNYDTLICCEHCEFTSATWSILEAFEGTSVELNVQGTDSCDGKNVSFEVFEKELIGKNSAITNPVNVVFEGNSATGTWVAEWIDDGFAQGNPEYVYKASLVNAPSTFIKNNEELTVLPSGSSELICIGINSCSDYLTESECELDSTSLGCGVAYGEVQVNNPLITCGEGGISCECSWISGQCGASYTSVVNISVIGTCFYDETTEDNCDDGFLSYSWESAWVWGHDGFSDWNDGPSESVESDYESIEGLFYYDPYEESNNCQDGSTLVECTASIQVGFFGGWNFIIVIIILVCFYFLREIKKK